MTELLERAFAQASKLSPEQQDAIADWLLKELDSETRWDGLFAPSQDCLSKLGSEALDEHRQGNTQELDSDQRQALEAYKLFRQDPNHPSLRFKKVHKTEPIYSTRQYRFGRFVLLMEMKSFGFGSARTQTMTSC